MIDQKINEADSSLQYQNYSQVSVWGVDADLNYTLTGGTHAFLRYSYQHAKDPYLDESLSNAPLHLIKAGLALPISGLFNCAAEVIYESGRKCLNGSYTKDFFLMNLTISAINIFDNFRLSLRIKNLLNTTYSYPGGYEHLMPAIVQDGRTYFLRGDFEF